MTTATVIIVSLLLMWPVVGLAYIGPGMGAGVIATALGFVGAILLGLFAVLYYPIKEKTKNRLKCLKMKQMVQRKIQRRTNVFVPCGDWDYHRC